MKEGRKDAKSEKQKEELEEGRAGGLQEGRRK